MHTLVRISIAMLIAALPVPMSPGSARGASTEMLDQEQTAPWTQAWRIGSGYNTEMAQIVTAGPSTFGYLSHVSVCLDNVSARGPITVTIQTVIAGEPSGLVKGYGEIPVDDLSAYDDPGWVNVSIHGNMLLAPGTRYAIVLSFAAGTIRWYSSGDVYPDGSIQVNDGSGWINWSPGDALFQTYIFQDELDQAQNRDLFNLSFGMGSPDQVGQTFTAGLSGVLDRVRLYLRREGGDPNLKVSIQTLTEEGFPSGIEIGHGSVPGSSVLLPWSWVSIGINGAHVVAGTQYALVLTAEYGQVEVPILFPDWGNYGGGDAVYNEVYSGGGWTWEIGYTSFTGDMVFETYVARPIQFSPPPPPPPPVSITPCSFGVCPSVTARITPADSVAHITSNVQFRERRDGTIHGSMSFNDSRTGSLLLLGCTTDSNACRLTVTTFACTAQDEVTIQGTYTPKGEDDIYYQLILRGFRDDVGTFTMTVGLPEGDQTYTFTRDGIVDVTCPPSGDSP